MTTVITLINEKGGVGKTSTAVHLAAGLAIRGSRVVLIDVDAQGHAGLMLGIAKSSGAYDLLVRDAAWKDVLRPVSREVYEIPGHPVQGQLFIVPSNVETRNIANSIDDAFKVKARLDEIREGVDYVIFDTSPTPSLLHGSVYLATDAVLYPTRLEKLSFDGLVESMKHREMSNRTREMNGLRPLLTLGIIPTMTEKTVEHNANFDALVERYGPLVWERIPKSTIWAEATKEMRAVWNYAPDSKAALAAWALVERVEQEVQRAS